MNISLLQAYCCFPVKMQKIKKYKFYLLKIKKLH